MRNESERIGLVAGRKPIDILPLLLSARGVIVYCGMSGPKVSSDRERIKIIANLISIEESVSILSACQMEK